MRRRKRKGDPTGWFCIYVRYFRDVQWHRQYIADNAWQAKFMARWNVHTFRGIECAYVENKQGQIIAIYEKDDPKPGFSRERWIGGKPKS
jgi:hypothetical protein